MGNDNKYNKPKVACRAPYNFVPFRYEPFCRYETMEDLPGHDTLDRTLLSGQIEITLTAETPVCISDGSKIYFSDGKKMGKDPDFVKGTDGRYRVPGSSMRGLIRHSMQILGLGLVRPDEDFTNRRFYYRKLEDDVQSPLTAPVIKQYRDLMGIPEEGRERQGTVFTAQKVRCGYLYKNKEDKYYIVPVEGEWRSIPRSSPVVKKWIGMYSKAIDVWYRLTDGRVSDIQVKWQKGYDKGMLVSPGCIYDHPTPLYLFPEENKRAEIIHLDKEDWLSYAQDYKERKNTLRGTQRNMDPEYWALPRYPGEGKPVFYIVEKADGEQKRVLFGMSRFLRVPYLHRLAHGLPEAHKAKQDRLFIDYPYAIMGFASKKDKNDKKDKVVSYRSRISVGDLPAEGEVQIEKYNAVLADPKPSFFPNYVVDGKDYNRDEFELAGYKQYWMKDVSVQSGKENVNSAIPALPAGTRFTGTIRYRNLSVDELGLLLWCLRLEQGCFHTLGKGKPYGFGRMKLEITELREYEPEQLYKSLQGGAYVRKDPEKIAERVNQLIDCYRYMVGAVRKAEQPETYLIDLPHIQDFFYMKRYISRNPWEVSYMRIKKREAGGANEFRDATEPLRRAGSRLSDTFPKDHRKQ